ncbi:MAG: undecaprenyldiphospho-muramoylpentapeptide beta-N-acetylglucosaminyltransferase [Gammaproteobacteria bacterium]
MPDKTIMIMAGGTGGHVYPALAVADYLKQQGFNLLWLGTERGLEYRVVPERGYTLLTISVAGVRGKGLLRTLVSPFMLAFALIQALLIMIRLRPAAVLGMGGFASGPGGVAAWMMRIPLLIHEQNAIAGLTNKLLVPFARKVMAAFPGAFEQMDKLIISGNPVRDEISSILPPEKRLAGRSGETLNVLVLGGSLGALKLNEQLPAALAAVDQCRLNIRHQCGEAHQQLTEQKYEVLGIHAEVMPYIDNMAEQYSWADIVICRAGALTIAELAATGVGSILVPYPHAVDDHQTANARYLEQGDAAVIIQQPDLNAERIKQVLGGLCQSYQRCIDMASKARALAKPDATRLVAENCMEAAHA